MSAFKVAIVGLASIASRSVIPAIREHPDFQLTLIGTRSIDKSAEKFPELAGQLTSYEEAIADSEADVVYLPLPNSMHHQWIGQSFDSGKHCWVEKSLCCNLKETAEVVESARDKDLVLLENFQFKTHPQFHYIKEVIDSGELGSIRCLRASFGFPPFPSTDNIRYQESLGGGALLDAGAYTVKVVQLLLGIGLEVDASTMLSVAPHHVDIYGTAMLRSASAESVAHIAWGFDNQYRCGIEVWGSKGRLTTNRLFTAPPDHDPEILIERGNQSEMVQLKRENHFHTMLDHLKYLIESKEGRVHELEENLDQSRIIEEIKRKAAEQ